MSSATTILAWFEGGTHLPDGTGRCHALGDRLVRLTLGSFCRFLGTHGTFFCSFTAANICRHYSCVPWPVLLHSGSLFCTHMLWSLRNKLVITYLLIGLAPVVLFVTLVSVMAYVAAGQFSIHLVDSRHSSLLS